MGLGGINVWQLLIVLLIVVLLFGTKKLKSLGEDLGGAVKGFKKGLGEAEAEKEDDPSNPASLNQTKQSAADADSTTNARSDSEKAETRP